MNWDSLPTQEFSKKPMNLNTTADAVMMFCILAAMTISDALLTLLSIPKKGVFRNQRQLLMQRTNRELRQMLMGTEIKGIARLKKSELVDLLVA
tara:strand:- start:154 stop:435 length:282 start_codon:yes stop_codon:yes gene_type:complete